MFKQFASDALGLSDIGQIISPENYNKVEADDYIMNENNERIYFLIKSKSDEYCFTNLALIHVDGTSALNKKRTLRRYEYHLHHFDDVTLETAGNIDLDVEIKFTLGDKHYSIDVDKKQLNQLKDLYKALIKISEITKENQLIWNLANESIQHSSNSLGKIAVNTESLAQEFKQLNEYTFNWLLDHKRRCHLKDLGFVFEKYINN